MTLTIQEAIKALIRTGAACPHMEMDDDGTGTLVAFGPIQSPAECGTCRGGERERAQAAVKRAKQKAAQEAREMRASLSDEEKQAILLKRPDTVLHTWEGKGYWRKVRPTEKIGRGGLSRCDSCAKRYPLSNTDEAAPCTGHHFRMIDGVEHVWEPPAMRSRVITAQRAVDMQERAQERIDRATGYVGRTIRY